MPSIKRLTAITALSLVAAFAMAWAGDTGPWEAQATADGTRQAGITVTSPTATFSAPLTPPGFGNPQAGRVHPPRNNIGSNGDAGPVSQGIIPIIAGQTAALALGGTP